MLKLGLVANVTVTTAFLLSKSVNLSNATSACPVDDRILSIVCSLKRCVLGDLAYVVCH